MNSTKRLEKDLSFVRNIADRERIILEVNPNVLHRWRAHLFDFPEESILGKDLATHQLTGVDVELEFPENFPMSPPALRVIQPKLSNRGKVNFGGIILLPTLFEEAWTCVITSDQILRQIRTFLEDSHVDLSSPQYTKEEVQNARLLANQSSFSPIIKPNLSSFMHLTNSILPSANLQPFFIHTYTCYSSTLKALVTGEQYLEKMHSGNKILLPSSALGELTGRQLVFPYQFEIYCKKSGILSHCGVLEFTAPEGEIVVPPWMMKNLAIEEEGKVVLKSVSLPKGTYAKIQPHTSEFINDNDHDIDKVLRVLETHLTKFGALSMGDQIEINHDDKLYLFNILETQPASAISIVADPYLDLKIDFAPPLDASEDDEKEYEKIAKRTTETTEKDKEGMSVEGAIDQSGKGPEKKEALTPGHVIGNDPLPVGVDSAICSNCKQAVPSSSLFMHENTCRRRNALCEKCGKVVEKTQLEAHMNQFHQKLRCECGEEVEVGDMEDHKKEICIQRKVKCPYCNLVTKAINVGEHLNLCGNKSSICDKCHKSVLRKDFDKHAERCGISAAKDQNKEKWGGEKREAEERAKLRDVKYGCPHCPGLGDNLAEEEFIFHYKTTHQFDGIDTICPICLMQLSLRGEEYDVEAEHDLFTHMDLHLHQMDLANSGSL